MKKNMVVCPNIMNCSKVNEFCYDQSTVRIDDTDFIKCEIINDFIRVILSEESMPNKYSRFLYNNFWEMV